MKKLFIFAFTAFLLLTACQATPDAPIVVQKDMEQMLEKAQKTPISTETMPDDGERYPLLSRLGAPERYTADITPVGERLTMDIDAVVRVPEAEAMPIAQVRPIQFTQEVVSAFFDRFRGGVTLYDTTPSGFNKAWLEKNILRCMSRVKESTGKEREKAQKMLDFLEAELAAIPDDPAKMISDGTLREMIISTNKPDIGRYMGVSAVEKPFAASDESYGRSFSVRNDPLRMAYDDESVDWGEEIGASLSYNRGSRVNDGGAKEIYTLLLDESVVPEQAKDSLTITPSEARALVESTISALPVSLKTDSVFLLEQHYYLTETVNGETQTIYDVLSDEPPRCIYIVTLGQSVGGIPCRNVLEANANNFKTETSLTPSWFYERIKCVVSDEGIESFSWRAPMEITEIITENANLLPFSEIASIAMRMLPVIYGGYVHGDDDLLRATLNIDRIQLELQRVTEENAIEYGLVIPVWNFYGEYVSEYEWATFSSKPPYDLPGALLTINAVDGSVIDPQKGY